MAQPIQRARQALRQASHSMAESARSYLSTSGPEGDDSDVEAQGRDSRRGSRRAPPSRQASFEGHLGLLFTPESLERDHQAAPRSALVSQHGMTACWTKNEGNLHDILLRSALLVDAACPDVL